MEINLSACQGKMKNEPFNIFAKKKSMFKFSKVKKDNVVDIGL